MLLRLFPALALLALAHAAAAQGQTPPRGVYACQQARPALNAPGCVSTASGCMGVQVQPAPAMMFALLDGATYMDHEGQRGRYSYNPANGDLVMQDGRRQGWRYRRIAQWSFRLLDPQGLPTDYACPLDARRDPMQRPW